jgi:hypothetical protein
VVSRHEIDRKSKAFISPDYHAPFAFDEQPFGGVPAGGKYGPCGKVRSQYESVESAISWDFLL